MRRIFSIAGCLLLSSAIAMAKPNLADYPLRVHVFAFNGALHYRGQSLDQVDGEGRANLYENGDPKGFDFHYSCGDRLRVSPGFETYLARWKKSGQTLEILLPEFGKPGAVESCELKVIMKDSAYVRRNGGLAEEPAALFKEWMIKHKYDPEHGLSEPVRLPQEQSNSAQPGTGSTSAQ
jgi:hypothetical protein